MQISLKNVSYTYNYKTPYAREVLKDINLKIDEGSYTVIVGKTGSGKSTLIEHINGLLLPTKGEVAVDNILITNPQSKKERRELAKKLKILRQDVAVLFQFSEQQLFETSVLKDIIFAPLNYGVAEEKAILKAKELIKLVGLDESYLDKSPFELSGGEMRKVALCGVLALEPKVLILDEPTVALDYQSREEIMAMVKRLKEEFDMTIVLVTHNMDYVLEYADKVFVLKNGEISFEGKVEDLFLNEQVLKENSLELPEVLKFYKKLEANNIVLDVFPRKYEELINALKKQLKTSDAEVMIAPTFTNLWHAFQSTKDYDVEVIAQNMHYAENGAYTGEISANMLKSIGVKTVILGHSERRAYFNETDESLAKKVDTALENNMRVIFCFGEELADRKANKEEEVVENQINNALFHLEADAFKNIVLAYEPVWAIGTGETATPEQAQDMHAFIRKTLAAEYGNEVANEVSILYGGSVKPNNAKEIFSKPDVDGGLIGGASLKAEDFFAIVNAF